MPLEIFDNIEQGTPEWKKARAGVLTGSGFHKVMSKGEGKVRAEYLNRLAAENITGEPIEESYKSSAMERGNVLEPQIRNDWCLDHSFDIEKDVKRVGFIKKGPIGCSPDLLIGNDGIAEFKSIRPDLLLDVLRKGRNSPDWYPPEHRYQVQGSLWVTGRQWCWLVVDSKAPNLPYFERKIARNLPDIEQLHAGVRAFHMELHELVRLYKPDGIPPLED